MKWRIAQFLVGDLCEYSRFLHMMLHCLTFFVSFNFFVWAIDHNEEYFSGVIESEGPDSRWLKLVNNYHLCESHNRIVPSYLSIYDRWESLCSGKWDTTVVLLHAVEENSTRSRQTSCVHVYAQWYGCACPMSFYGVHCELLKARTGCLETVWYVIDITGNNRKKPIFYFLAWGKLLTNFLWEVLTELKYAYIQHRIWEPSLELKLEKWLHDSPFRENDWEVGACCLIQKEAEHNKIFNIFPLGLRAPNPVRRFDFAEWWVWWCCIRCSERSC